MTSVFANERWYRDRPEPERTWHGTLVRVSPVSGPKGRTALTHALRTEAAEIPVYGAGAGEALAPFVGKHVAVAAKMVDLSAEGFGRELWVARIDTIASSS